MPPGPPPRQVALLIETSNAYARGLLQGVHRYSQARGGWHTYLGEHSRLEADFSWLAGWEGDGVLARVENEATARFIRELGLPTVDLSAARLLPTLPGVETNNNAIARLALDHFEQRGLRHYAYCGDDRFAWSVERAACFARHAHDRGATAHQFRIAQSGLRSTDRELLAAWLSQLPTPVGVLACYDIVGQEVLEACTLAGLPVPDAVAVIGVDNDELIGNLASPPLSSIELDTMHMGYLAAELLDQAMDGIVVAPGLRLIDPVRVVSRQSSDVLAVDDTFVAEALGYIREHAERNVTVAAVLRHVGLSRRALDQRFASAVGRTVHDEIVRVRMEGVAALLASTDWTLQRIAERLEFRHAEYMGVAFKRHTGKTPGEYRRSRR